MSIPESFKDKWKFAVPGQRQVWELHRALRRQIAQKWHRSLPFAEQLFDRWERAAWLGFGKETSIYDSSVVLGDVRVGEKTWIGPFTVLDGRGGLSIGSFCSISSGVQIYSHDTLRWALTRGKAKEERAATSIGDCCYVGPQSVIAKGVRVGDHCVVGANSLVKKDVPACSIVAGTPAKVIGRVEVDGEEVKLIYNVIASEAKQSGVSHEIASPLRASQ